jgi:hypothetical protein
MILSLISPVFPARGELYSWKDRNGIENFSNSRENVPPDAKVQVWTEKYSEPPDEKASPEPSASPETAPSRSESNPPAGIDPSLNAALAKTERATQGRFAVQLVEELGLGDQPTAEEAASLLSRIRVSPPLGRWELERPITSSLVSRLRTLTVSAAEMGTISIAPGEALLAFDTTAALLGVPIVAGAENDLSDSSYTTVIQSPPLVLIAPPPPIYATSYVWVPVQQGFFWSGVWCSGFFVLDVGHRDFRFHRHRFDLPRGRIEHRFTDHVVRPRLHGRDGFPVTRPFQPRPPAIGGRRTEVRPYAPPPQLDRRLRGGSPRSFSTMPRGGQAVVPPSLGTPMTPRSGRSAPPATQMTPLAPRTPMTPMTGQLRGRSTTRPPLTQNSSPASPEAPAPGGGGRSLRRG